MVTMPTSRAHGIAVVGLLLVCSCAASHVATGPVSFWNWRESVADPALRECTHDFRGFMEGHSTSMVHGSNMYLSTNFMFLCDNVVDQRRKANLQKFVKTQRSFYNSTTDLLFGQSHSNKNSAGIGLWVQAASTFIQQQQQAGEVTPALRFDVEYDPTADDAFRVLKMAAWVREELNNQFPDPATRPRMYWALDFAAMLDLPASNAPCPAAGANNETMLLGECFLRICDGIDLMDFRSYAVQQPVRLACDGAALFAAPFFIAAKRLNKTVTIGFETDCGLGKYTYKISFCAPEQKNFTSDPLQYMYDNIAETAWALQHTSAALAKYPCAAKTQGSLPPLPAGEDLWTGVAATPAFVIEDLYAWTYLAYNGTNIAPLACPGSVDSWTTCISPAKARTSPTNNMF